ncbi:MAG TPA: hypothetical protein VHL98_11320 [Microvirga sp.]|jgi:hypothetical protein|nr:hypothetical protein [Microvirga sp.]
MTDADRIADFLFRAAGTAYCDECLSQELAIPLAQVREQAGLLADEGWTKRSEETCAGCGGRKLVIRRRVSAFAS